MPDGHLVAFPADMPSAEIQGLIAGKYPNEVQAMLEKKGLADNMGSVAVKSLVNLPGMVASQIQGVTLATNEGFGSWVAPTSPYPDGKPPEPTGTPEEQLRKKILQQAAKSPAGQTLAEMGLLKNDNVAVPTDHSGAPVGSLPWLKGKSVPSYDQPGALDGMPVVKQAIGRWAANNALRAQLNIAKNREDAVEVNVVPGSWASIVGNAPANAANMALPIVVGLLTKQPGIILPWMAGQSAGDAYITGKEAGLRPQEGLQYAVLKGLAEAIPEKLPLHEIIAGKGGFLKKILKSAGLEGASEDVTELLNMWIDKKYLNIDDTWYEAQNKLFEAFAGGAIMGGTVSAATQLFQKALGIDPNGPKPGDPLVDPPPGATPEADPGASPPAGPTAPAALNPPEKQLALPSPEAYAPPDIPRRQPPLAPEAPADDAAAKAAAEEAETEIRARAALTRTKQTETAALLQTARETVSPLGSFTAADGVPDRVVGRINQLRINTGVTLDTPMTIEEVAKAGATQTEIDALIAKRKPLTSGRQVAADDIRAAAKNKNIRIDDNFNVLSLRATGEGMASIDTMSQTQLSSLFDAVSKLPAHDTPVSIPIVNAERFTDKQYADAVTAVTKQGRYTLAAVKAATGLKTTVDAESVRDAMVQRAVLRQHTAKDYRLNDVTGQQTKPIPANLPPGAFIEHVVKEQPVGAVVLEVNGKKGKREFASEAAASDAVREIRAKEAGGTTRAELKIVPAGRTAFAVIENHDEDGAHLGGAAVETYDNEKLARAAADKRNAPETGNVQRPTPAVAEVLPEGDFILRKDGVAISGHKTATELREAARALRDQHRRLGLPAPDLAVERAPGVTEAMPRMPKPEPAPRAPRPAAPAGIAGRSKEVMEALDKQASTRGLPLLGTKVRLADDILDDKGNSVEGTFSRTKNLIRLRTAQLSADMSTQDVIDVLGAVMDHEIIHALAKAGVLDPTSEGWKTLLRYATKAKHPNGGGMTYLQHAQALYADFSNDPAYIQEEAIAEVFRHWAANRRNVVGKPATVLQQLVRWFMRLIRAIPDAPSDLLGTIESGRMDQRFMPPGGGTPEARAIQAKAKAATSMAAAKATGNAPAAKAAVRAYVRARDQSRENRYGKAGAKTVIGDTPTLTYATGENAALTDVDDIIAKFEKASGQKSDRHRVYLPEDEAFLRDLAAAQEKAVHNPKSDAVAKAYRSLTAETRTMFDALKIKVEVFTGPGEAYASPLAMFNDVVKNKRIKIRLSSTMFGTSPGNADHPMYAPSGVVAADGKTILSHNDVFRIVHELYGHAPNGLRYQPRDAYNAYHTHRMLYTKEAVPALLTETLAQSAWQNYGAHMRRSDGTVPDQYDADYLPLEQRPFAQQKAYVLPDMVFADKGVRASAEAAKAEDLGDDARFSLGDDTRYSINSPQFQSWFGNSAVSNRGLPTRVYHSTAGADFNEFDTTRSELGAHFGTQPQSRTISSQTLNALGKIGDKVTGTHVYPAYLSIQRPLRLRDEGTFNNSTVADQLADLGIISYTDAEGLKKYGYENRIALQKAIQAAGYDGVVYLNRLEGMDFRPGTYPSDTILHGFTDERYVERYPTARDSWIAFEPTQIKSAIGNNGNYDPANPDIRFSVGDLKTRMMPNGDTPDRISTRQPTTLRGLARQNPLTDNLIIDLAAMKADPVKFAANMELVKSYPGFRTTATDPDQIAEEFIDFVVGNLVYLHNRVPEEIRQRSKLWYDGARAITERWARQYDLPDYVIAGVLASLSPQKDWYQNVSLAERVLDIYTSFTTGNNRAFRPTPEMRATAARIYAKEDYAENVRTVLGAPLMDMPSDVTKAMWVRIYDETYNPRGFRTVSPEGDFIGQPDGNVAWGSNVEIAKAISAIGMPTRDNVSERMGEKHKVRNFYNNILAPKAPWGDVTIDTHAVAAALIRPLSGSSAEVHHNFGSSPEKAKQPIGWIPAKNIADNGAQGTYGIYAEAYRRAAQQLGVLPRELQSITWEAVRGLFPAVDKRNAGKVQQVLGVWNAVKTGALGVDAARARIEALAGGINDPTWYGSDSGGAGAARPTSYEGELARARIQRASTGQLGAAGGPAGRAAEPAAGRSVPGRDDFYLDGGTAADALNEEQWDTRFSITSPRFDETYGDRLPGGRLYGSNTIDPATVMSPPGTSPVALSRPVDGGAYFGGRLADAQLRMAQDGIDGVSMIYLRIADFLKLAGPQIHAMQDVINTAVERGLKFNALPSIWFDGNDGVVRAVGIDGVYAAQALAGKAQRLPVLIQRKGQQKFGSLVGIANGDTTIAMPNGGLQEFNVDRRGDRYSVGSEKFNKWFRQSRVVDAKGKPLIVYHGSEAEFTVFDKSKSASGYHGGGFYFTPDQAWASSFGQTKAVYLSLQNPFNKDTMDITPAMLDEYTSIMQERGATDDWIEAKLENTQNSGSFDVGLGELGQITPAEIQRVYKAGGFDGVIAEDGNVMVAFEPTQIKSAIGNRGTWSAADPDIRYSLNSPIGTRVPSDIRYALPLDPYSVVFRQNAVWFGVKVGDMMEKFFRSKKRLPGGIGWAAEKVLGGDSFYTLTMAHQDKNLPMLEFVQRVREEGGTITDDQNAWLMEQAVGSKATYRIEEHKRLFYDPLIAAIKAAHAAGKFTLPEFEMFLYARHAPERNAFLRSRGSKKANPSGMSEAEAQKIIDDFRRGGKLDEMVALDPMVRALVASITKTRVDGGLLDPKDVSTVYNYWAPMRNGEDFDPYDQTAEVSSFTGRGMSVGGKESRPTVGRDSKAGDLLANMILQDTMAIVRAEHAAYNRIILEMIASNPALAAQDIEIMTTPELKTVVGSDGRIRTIVDPNFRSKKGIYVTKVAGREVVMKIHNPMIERALTGSHVMPTGPLTQALGNLVRLQGRTLTTANPDFIVPNFLRDLQAATLNLAPQAIKGIVSSTMAGIGPAARAVSLYHLSETAAGRALIALTPSKGAASDHTRYYQEMKENGWMVSHMGLQSLESVVNRIRKDAHSATGWRLTAGQAFNAARNVFGGIEATLGVAEQGVRLSAYTEMRRAGFSIAQAGGIAKNLTVNFNKRGERTAAMNMYYLFYGAAMQAGSIIGVMAKSKRGQVYLAAIASTGFVLDIANRLLSGDDNDDGIPDYDEMSEFELSHNFIFPNLLSLAGVKGQPRYVKIPMALGYNGVHNIGRNVGNMFLRKNKTWVDSVMSMGTGMIDAFNPIAVGGNIVNFFMPTLADPIVDVFATNTKFDGSHIVPPHSGYGLEPPMSQRYWASTEGPSVWLAEQLNKLGGGNEVRPGVWGTDVSPEQIEYFWGWATGGVGRFATNAWYAATEGVPLSISGKFEDIDVTRISLLRAIVPGKIDRSVTGHYYDLSKGILTVEEEVKLFNELGQPARARDARQKNPVDFAMIGVFSGADRQISDLRKQIRDIAADTHMKEDRKKTRTKQLRDQMNDIMARALKSYYRTKDAAK